MVYAVFEPVRLGALELANRFVRSATWDATADEAGAATDHSARIYEGLAAGGIGLIVTGYAFVSDHGKANVGQYGIHTDAMIPGLRRIVQAAHQGGARIAVQIVHSGLASGYFAKIGRLALAPSQLEGKQPHREMTEEEIEGIVGDFVAAALRAREAGFDAVQLHGAHGYLMSQFFSPITNRRQDRWGGTPENRRRFHVEVVRRVRQAVGPDYPLLIKFGIMDDEEGGATLGEGIAALRAMAEAGLDAVEVSGGIGGGRRSPTRTAGDGQPEEIYYRERAAAARKAVSIPVAVVGGIRSLETAEDIVRSGDADGVALSRPLIREPGLIRRWQSGDLRPATCITCNKCMGIARRGEPLECGEDKRLRQERGRGPHP